MIHMVLLLLRGSPSRTAREAVWSPPQCFTESMSIVPTTEERLSFEDFQPLCRVLQVHADRLWMRSRTNSTISPSDIEAPRRTAAPKSAAPS